MPARQEPQAVASIPLPSADLITFRFDQTDKKLDDFSRKLDHLTNTFVTREEARFMKEERDAKFAEIQRQFDSYRWYWRALVVAFLTALGTAVAALITKG